MKTQDDLTEYRQALQQDVCSRCVERRAGAPPCSRIGKGCGIERHLPVLIVLCRTTDSALIDPYIEKLHETICVDCEFKDKPTCPCPLDYLLPLAVEAVDNVEHRRAVRQTNASLIGGTP
jgi:hypothetical protein